MPARASTAPSRSIAQIRAVVRDRPSMICAISGDADGGMWSTPLGRVVRALPRKRGDGVGPGREEPRPVVQRGRDRLCGAGERPLLRIAQHALQFAHVLDAQPGQRQEHV